VPWNYHQGMGEPRTVPVGGEPGTVEIPPDELEILQLFGLDPDTRTVTAIRQSRWRQTVTGGLLSAYRVSVQRRTSGAQFDVQTVAARLERQKGLCSGNGWHASYQ
jgi:hypothetical protein